MWFFFGVVVVGCADDPTNTPLAEVEVLDTMGDTAEPGDVPDDSADTADPADVPADTVDTADPGDALADAASDTSEVVGPPCDAGCPPGLVCDGAICVCDTTPVSYAADIAPRFATSCGPGCHVYSNAASGSAGLNVALAHGYKDLVGVTAFQCRDGRVRVAPGDPAGSYLMQKMLGRDMCTGVRMPKGRQVWSADDLAMLGRWICQGARDD